jgi:hypothetical protein
VSQALITKKFLTALTLAIAFASAPAWAIEASSQEGPSIPCAVIDRLAGAVEIFDSSRTHLLSAIRRAGVPCGGWISTGQAWVELKHRDGHRIHVGSHSFVQFPENNRDGYFSGDHAIVYKGHVFGRAGGGVGELRVATANARARVTRGSVVLSFTQENEESQMITLDNFATIENVFENSKKITVKAGEASSLNLLLQRVVPTAGKAIAVAELKPKLVDLHLDQTDFASAIERAVSRGERRMASHLVNPENGAPLAKPSVNRSPASLRVGKAPTYERHQLDKQNSVLMDQWTRKLVGGQAEGQRILFPDRFYGKPQNVQIQVIDPDAGRAPASGRALSKADETEKKKLIEELTKIREN